MANNSPFPSNHPAAQFRGMLTWSCPACHSIHKTRIRDGIYTAECGTCRLKWAFGLAFHKMNPGIMRTPIDTIMPIALKSGGRVNVVISE